MRAITLLVSLCCLSRSALLLRRMSRRPSLQLSRSGTVFIGSAHLTDTALSTLQFNPDSLETNATLQASTVLASLVANSVSSFTFLVCDCLAGWFYKSVAFRQPEQQHILQTLLKTNFWVGFNSDVCIENDTYICLCRLVRNTLVQNKSSPSG